MFFKMILNFKLPWRYMGKIEKNVKTATDDETQARKKSTFYARVAREEEYQHIAKPFKETRDKQIRRPKEELRMSGNPVHSNRQDQGVHPPDTSNPLRRLRVARSAGRSSGSNGNS
jgi:rubrerythrin